MRVHLSPVPPSPSAQVDLIYRMGASRDEPQMRGETGADEATRTPRKPMEGSPSGHIGGT